MQVIRDGIQLCADCLFAAVNGDFSDLDYHYTKEKADERQKEIEAGLSKLGPHLVENFDGDTGDGINEFSELPCDCCGSKLAGSRHEFAILGP